MDDRGNRDRKGHFLPGHVANPSGRPKVDPTLRDAARALTQVALQTLSDICANPGAPESARVTAACALLDRGHGKPQQSLDVTTHDDGASEVRATLARIQADPLSAAALLTLAEVSARAD